MDSKLKIIVITLFCITFFVSSVFTFLIIVTKSSNVKGEPPPLKPINHLNILLLLDLSDRVQEKVNYGQSQRDILIIQELLKVFSQAVKRKLYIKSKDKFQIVVIPQETNPNFSDLVDAFTIDMSKFKMREKKGMLKSSTESLIQKSKELYQRVGKLNRYSGADIWKFFKEDIRLYIEDGKEYQNLVVLLTDGYMFAKNNKCRLSNRFTFIMRWNLWRFRNKFDWETEFDSGDYGLIKTDTQLPNTKVLLLEFKPETEFNNEFQILSKYWTKWFNEMNVSQVEMYKSYNDFSKLKDQIINFAMDKK